MKIIIKDEKRNEENMLKNEHKSPILTIISIIMLAIFFYLFYNAGGLNIMIVFAIFWGILFVWGDETITLDKGLKRVVIEHRWNKTKTINFSNIKEVRAFEDISGDTFTVDIELITNVGSEKVISDWDTEKTKKLAVRICKIIGVNGYYIDLKKNRALLIGSSIIFNNNNKTINIDDIVIKEIKLSEIITPIIDEETDNDGGKTWNIDLILTNQEKPQRIFRGEDEKEAKALLGRIFNFLDDI